MAKATASIIARKQWWFTPAIFLIALGAKCRLLNAGRFERACMFAGEYGFKYEVKR